MFLILFVAALTWFDVTRVAHGAYCGANQHYEECGTACPLTCNNYNDPPSACTANCVSGCQCDDGYILDQYGNCVAPSQCPSDAPLGTCSQNEYYSSCVNPCNDCQNRGICRNSYNCYYGCDCIQGYYRNPNGQCVPAQSCPNTCKQNEYFSSCVNPCNDCQNRGICRDTYYCYYGCDCIQGYYRNANGQCVLADSCPNNCTQNEVYTNCKIPCNDCYSRGNCYYYCYPGCNCKNGFYNDANGNCVPANQCPARNG